MVMNSNPQPPGRSIFGIGASDIAAIVGQSKYSSPWDVYRRLTAIDLLQGQIDEPVADLVAGDAELEQDERDVHSRTGWGHRLEPVIRQAYCDETGLEVVIPGSLFHQEHRWARATPDGIAWPFDQGHPANMLTPFNHNVDRLVQIKNVGQYVAAEWAEAPPAYVQLQEQWELYVTGLARADVAALIGGGEFRVFTIWRDDRMIADLVTIAEDFWTRVQQGRPPEIDGSNACRAQMSRHLAGSAAVEMTADADAEQLAQRYQEYYLAADAAEAGKKLAANQLLGRLVDAGATKIRTELGVIGTRRVPEKTVEVVDWETAARDLAMRLGGTSGDLERAIQENTRTVTKPGSISIVAPRSWSALKKGPTP